MIATPLSDDDIRTILGSDTKILKYSELSEYSNLNELLPRPIDFAIILYEHSRNSGHWVALSLYNGMYEIFDPFGVPIDQ
jgi:hypothetical protein